MTISRTMPDYWVMTTPILLEALAENSAATPKEVADALATAALSDPEKEFSDDELVAMYRDEYVHMDA